MIKNNIFSCEIQKIVKSLAKRIAGKHKDLRDDLVQEGYLILREASENYDPQRGVPFEGFAYVVLRHALPKVAKRITQVISTEEEYTMDSLDELQSNETARNVCDFTLTPCERFELEDTRRAIRKAVELLPRKERIAISLLYGLDGLYERTLTNVAEELHCSVEGASKTSDRAFKSLRVSFRGPEYSLCA